MNDYDNRVDYERIIKINRALMARITPRPSLFLDIEVTEHCNLNCKSCGSFAPLADEEYVDINELASDLKRLSELSAGEVHHINILCGEPLLHPEITKIIEIVRHYFPYGNIYLVTNGVLLNRMDESFWQQCKQSNIVIEPTQYPIKINYDEIQDMEFLSRPIPFCRYCDTFASEKIEWGTSHKEASEWT